MSHYFFLLGTIPKIFAIYELSENNRMLQVISLVLLCNPLKFHIDNTEIRTLLENSEHDKMCDIANSLEISAWKMTAIYINKLILVALKCGFHFCTSSFIWNNWRTGSLRQTSSTVENNPLNLEDLISNYFFIDAAVLHHANHFPVIWTRTFKCWIEWVVINNINYGSLKQDDSFAMQWKNQVASNYLWIIYLWIYQRHKYKHLKNKT